MKQNWRRASAAALLCALVAVSLTCGALASFAQGGGRTRAQQQAQNPPKLKLTPLRSSESAKGSRVTITGTDSLGDYQSYRSGERFYVRIPNADAGAVRSGVRGRGFEDAQVQRSGGDVILSFRVKPGARPSVKQRFNQLDVEFAAPEGSGGEASPPAQGQTGEGRETNNATRTTATQTASQQTTSANEAAEARRAAEQRAQAQNAARGAGESLPPVADLPDQLQPAQNTQQTTAQTESATAATPSTPTEIAQATQPAQNPSGATTTTGAPSDAQSSATLGAAVARNWKPLAVIAAILAVGLGLFFVARRSSAQDAPPPPAPVREAEVAEAKTATLKEADATAVVDSPTTWTNETATTFAAAGKGKKKGKKARLKAERAAREEVAKSAAPVVAQEETSAAAEETPVVSASSEAVASVAAAEVEAAKVDEAKADEASVVAPVVASVAETEAAEEVAAEVSTAIEPAPVVYDAETVQSETRLLLGGEPYDAAVLATGDRTTRQMIAAELLAALAARNPARKERARIAFIEHGYFNETARDLREAEAPAERASAARSLGLAGDRLATPHLSAALEDSSVEVRRASVEALASVRDPEAVSALEELIAREKSLKTKVPRKVVQRAIEACAEAPATPPASLAAATATTVLAEATRAQEEAPAAPDDANEVAPAEESTPTVAAEGSTPTVAEEATPTVVEESTRTVVEERTPTLFERADETVVEEPAQTLAESATPTISESASPTLVEESTPTLVEESATPTMFDAPAPVTETAITPAPVEEEAAVEESSIEAPTFEEQPVEEATAPETVETAQEAEGAGTVEVEGVGDVEAAVEAVAETAAEPTAEVSEPEPVAEFEPASEAEPVTASESVSDIEPVSFVEPFETAQASESYETVEAYEPAAREVEAPEAAGEEFVEIAAFDAPADSFESHREAESGEVAPARFEDFETLAGPARVDEEWVELDFGVTASTPAQFSAQSTPAPPVAYEAFTEEIFTPPAAAESRDAQPPAPAETEEVTALAPAPPVAEVEPYAESQDVNEGALVAPPSGRHTTPPAGAQEKGVAAYTEEDYSTVPKVIRDRLTSEVPNDRAEAVKELARVESGEAFEVICAGFDDPSQDVRSAAARSLYDLQEDRADTFTRALREATPQRRRNIGSAIASSGLASEAISNLTGESREKTYDAFSLLFLMAKAGEVQPLVRAVEGHPDSEVRMAVVKLLALSGQKEILPAFRRLAVRGTLPAEVRAAVMEAIYQISSQETQPANRQS